MRRLKLMVFFIGLFTPFGCKELYHIPVKASATALLVVEGNINSGPDPDPTTVRLTRSTKLDTVATVPESGASVLLEGNDNSTAGFFETSAGYYVSSQLNINDNVQYRLHIITAGGAEYLSDYVTPKINPPIDSISWRRDNKGVTIYANTHNPLNNTKYYRWEYEETWEIHSPFTASVKFENGKIYDLAPADYFNVCWKYSNSSNILLGSSEKLSSDVIFEDPLVNIPSATEKLGVRYSILVRQFGLSKESYNYYQVMKKNTESLGSIFDAQPSELAGNIHSVNNPSEAVVGFVDISPVRQQRIFIDSSQVSNWGFRMNCDVVYVINNDDSIRVAMPGVLPFAKKFMGLFVVGYFCSEPECVDCRIRGGLLGRPFYW